MTTRGQAIQWWNSLKLTDKVLLMNKNNIESYRSSETLTEKEIEEIWRKENNIYLNRLKEQYKELKNHNTNIRKLYYDAMRLFCLDTQLLDFNTIEVMEYEVNSSF